MTSPSSASASALTPSDPASVSEPSSQTVRRSLRALADGSASGPTVTDPERVVAEAEAAVSCAREAVAYLVAGRLGTLDAAIGAAERRGEAELARRGRRSRETLRRLRTELEPAVGRDHFRPARGTVLGDSGQRPPR